jgi:hypothetical protein
VGCGDVLMSLLGHLELVYESILGVEGGYLAIPDLMRKMTHKVSFWNDL